MLLLKDVLPTLDLTKTLINFSEDGEFVALNGGLKETIRRSHVGRELNVSDKNYLDMQTLVEQKPDIQVTRIGTFDVDYEVTAVCVAVSSRNQ